MPRLDALFLRHEVETFNAAYAAALDEQRLSDWVEMFTDDARYVVISRENADRGMPVGLIYCENKGMIYDRAFALEKTAMFAPRYLRHIVGNLQVLGEERAGEIRARANYVVLQVLLDRPDAKLHQVGAYHDVFRRVGAPAEARRTPLRLRQPARRQCAVPAGLSVGMIIDTPRTRLQCWQNSDRDAFAALHAHRRSCPTPGSARSAAE